MINNSIVYLLMRPHRFAFNFGYGFDGNDDAMTSATFLFVSMFLELSIEFAIDIAALGIEQRHGIDVDRFWAMWQVNPGNFFGTHVVSNLMALNAVFWAFSTLPTPFFCTSQHDPCSCMGGGFQIFQPFCGASASAASEEATKEVQSNATNSSYNGTSSTEVPQNAYVDTSPSAVQCSFVAHLKSHTLHISLLPFSLHRGLRKQHAQFCQGLREE